MPLLPLEEYFRKLAELRSFEMPHMRKDYFSQYRQILNIFQNDYYPKVDAGLAALSDTAGIYTAHDAQHFDEVIVHAGNLLGITPQVTSEINVDTLTALNPYELYLLLVAIRVHDVGNMYGRDAHEKKCFKILQALGAAAGDAAEKKIIARIAEAHGGKTQAGSKDTIGTLDVISESGHVSFRPRLLAGIVRIADEICENSRRAAKVLLDDNAIPRHNEIYHHYAAAIVSNKWNKNDRALSIKFEIPLKNIERPWGCENRARESEDAINQVYLIDEIFSRLDKMDRERRYCNLYTREIFTIDSIRVTIDVINEEHDIIDSVHVPVLSDRGYPDDVGQGLAKRLSQYCGVQYGLNLREKMKG